jgi:hypothetical protein
MRDSMLMRLLPEKRQGGAGGVVGMTRVAVPYFRTTTTCLTLVLILLTTIITTTHSEIQQDKGISKQM